MKSHLMIALSLLLTAVFAVRSVDAVQNAASLLTALYLAGGFIFAAILFILGLRQRKMDREGS